MALKALTGQGPRHNVRPLNTLLHSYVFKGQRQSASFAHWRVLRCLY